MKANITEEYIKTLRPKDKLYIVWDTTNKGFGVIVNIKGKKTYVAQAKVNKKALRKKIGTVGDIPFDEALGLACAALVDMRGRSDILMQRVKEKQISAAAEAEMTVADLVEEFMTKHVERHCKPHTACHYRLNFENYFLPKFGNYKIKEVTRKDIRKLHDDLSDKPYTANRVIASVSKMYNQAKIWELCDGLMNPCMGIRKYREKHRVRYLRPEELKCLRLALNDEEAIAPMAVAAFRLLLYTGARRGEIQTLKWDYVNGNQIHLPDSKTGRKTVHLSQKAKQVLNAIPKINGNDYVITGQKQGAFLANFKHPWGRVRERATVYFLCDHSTDEMAQLVNNLCASLGELPKLAQCRIEAEEQGLKFPEGLSNLRIHDLRHNFASQLAMKGMSLPLIGMALGHKKIETTARYAHLDSSAVQEMIKMTEEIFADEEVSENPGEGDWPAPKAEPHDDPEKYEPIYDIQS